MRIGIVWAVLLVSILFSCSNDTAEATEESGISVVTQRNTSKSDGVGIACKVSDVIGRAAEEPRFEELKANPQFDTLATQLLERQDETLYVIMAGDDVTPETAKGIAVTGSTFSLFWFSGEEPVAGTYNASAVRMNVLDPENLVDGGEFQGEGDVIIELKQIDDTKMIGSFGGFITADGKEEGLFGSFNIDRIGCDE